MTQTPAAPTETNREIIRQAFEAWRQGTGAITEVFAPDMVWRIEGHSAASREYRSKQQFIDEVLAPFGARFTVSEPFRPVTIRGVYADGDTVIVIWDGRGITSDGQPARVPATCPRCPRVRSASAVAATARQRRHGVGRRCWA
jgi:ketosteroid isomerase-like protein